MLRWNRRRRAGNAYYLRARILQAHLSRNQTDERAEQQDPVADPDPGHEREHIELEDGFAVVLGHTREIDVQIFVQAAADADDGTLLLAGFVEANFGLELIDDLPVLRDLHRGVAVLVIAGLVIVHDQQLQIVVAEAEGLAKAEIAGLVLIEGLPVKPMNMKTMPMWTRYPP